MENNSVKKLTIAGMLLAFVVVIIFIGSRLGGAVFNSLVVGPLVNAVIISTVLIVGTKYGILMGFLTPLIAALTQQLAPPMVPFIPFIMIGNISFAVVFGLFNKYIDVYGKYIGIVAGAILKTIILVISVKYLVTLFKISIPKPVMAKLSIAMSYPQLYTAIAGGILALILYSIYKRTQGKA